MTLVVRPLEAADEADWRVLWKGYLDFYEASLPEEVTQLTWQRLLDPEIPMHAAVAVLDGRTVGLVQWLYHLSTWEKAARCYLNDLYALPETRGKGVGRALIEHVYAHCDARAGGQVYWLTQEFNATARVLYDRIGKVTPFIKYRR